MTQRAYPRRFRGGAHEISFQAIGEGPVVMLLHGGGPGGTGMSNYRRKVADLSKDFRVIVPISAGKVTDTGHWVQWERPEEFNATVSAFLKENTGGA